MRSLAMRLFVAALALVLVPVVADAGHRRHHHVEYNHRGWGEAYKPFYHRHYRSDWAADPYAYYPARRSYYPYYNSGYWRPTYELRYRRAHFRPFAPLPRYYQAWGSPAPIYYKRKWRRW